LGLISCNFRAGTGGGVGILGQGSNGAGGISNFCGTMTNGGGKAGSGGTDGGQFPSGNAGPFGGGATNSGTKIGAGGAVRIIWPGTTRSFPSTNTGNL
jgi:hypothetical protein